MVKRNWIAGIAGLMLMGVAAGVTADEGAIKYRQAVYKAIGGHMSAMAGIIKGEVPHAADLPVHARQMGELAPMVRHLFPAGSGEGKTKALPEIWEDPAGFAERVAALETAAANVAANADAPMGEFVPAFQQLGQACKGCHDNYKAD